MTFYIIYGEMTVVVEEKQSACPLSGGEIDAAIEEAFRPLADGTCDIELFAQGFRCGMVYLLRRIHDSVESARGVVSSDGGERTCRKMPSWFVH